MAAKPGAACLRAAHMQAGRARRIASLNHGKPFSGCASPARGLQPLVPGQVNAGRMGVLRWSIGDDGAKSAGIRAAAGRNRRQRPRSRGSGYFWNSGEVAFILPICETRGEIGGINQKP